MRLASAVGESVRVLVSIPDRDLGILRLDYYYVENGGSYREVSIPDRDLGILRHNVIVLPCNVADRFNP